MAISKINRNTLLAEKGSSNKKGHSFQSQFGDDGDEFMAIFGRQFNVGPGDFDETRYFGQEGFFLHGLIRALFKKQAPLQAMTLGMLYLAIQLGKWETATLEQARIEDSYFK